MGLPADAAHLRGAIELSREASRRGDEPYGAIVALADGTVLAQAGNTQHTARDCTGHAEVNALREAWRRAPPGALAGATLYASGEPCPMCAGALYYAGIGRVVFALDLASMCRAAGPAADEIMATCSQVLARGRRPVEVMGPCLADEALEVVASHYARAGQRG